MALIDSHAHLTFPELRDQLDAVFARCAAAGVERVITIGTDLADATEALALARQYPRRVHAAVGFHPHESDKVTDEDLVQLAELWDSPDVVGFGEMGLDYHYDFGSRENQHRVFRRQLELAASRDRPVVIHCREAIDDAVAMLLEHGFAHRPVVFHCFTGTRAEAERLAECGWRISFTGIVTFRRSTELQEIARAYPADQLMIETDAPYLSPEPVRNRRPNEPAHIIHTARFLADLRGEPFDDLAARTRANTFAFFKVAQTE